MKRILLLSDTHSHLDDVILKYAADCDEIWHAGDIGDSSVLTSLQNIKTTIAVFGNIDDHIVRKLAPENQRFTCEGMDVWMTHIGGRPGNYATPVRAQLKSNPPQIFVCGHSHICSVQFDKSFNMLYMNPGAAGKHGFHHMRTMLRFKVDCGKISDLEVIELGKRAR
ncbi:MAG: metallophosphoesterase family protein [Flavobacteriales bacterium]|nr:metallophosphoesterase family protein [Flavobacteriales bacterium]